MEVMEKGQVDDEMTKEVDKDRQVKDGGTIT